MTTKECNGQEQAADYALGLLCGTELAHFKAHVDECATCWMRVREMASVIELLPTSVPPVAPPAGLRERVLKAAGLQVSGGARTAHVPRLALPGWAVAAMMLMGVGLAGLGLRLQAVTDQVARLEAAGLRGGAAATAGTVQAIALSATPQAPGAAGSILVVPDNGGTYLVLRASGLAALSGEQVYHLWLIRDGQRTSGGTFVVNSEGLGGIAFRVPNGARYDAVGITREPDPHGMAPRGQKVLGADLNL